MDFLMVSILLLFHRAEPLQALDLGLGGGLILQKAGSEGFGQAVYFGSVLELSYARKVESAWIEFGLSGMDGGEPDLKPGLANDVIRGGGFHLDASYSLVESRHVDLKIGAGIGAKFVQRIHEVNTMDQWNDLHLASRQTRNSIQACGRGLLALNFHGNRGMGGVEFRPFKVELGPTLSVFTPSLAAYWPI